MYCHRQSQIERHCHTLSIHYNDLYCHCACFNRFLEMILVFYDLSHEHNNHSIDKEKKPLKNVIEATRFFVSSSSITC